VNTRSTLLNKQFCELHDGCQTTMSGIRIGDDWSQVVDVPQLLTIGSGCGDALLSLLAIVEHLRHEQMANLVRYGCLLGLVKLKFTNRQ
jgi:hypothetical protein